MAGIEGAAHAEYHAVATIETFILSGLVKEYVAMTFPAAAWQLDRLSADARDAAEVASLAAGLSLSAWLARVIAETCAMEGVNAAGEHSTIALDDSLSNIIEFSREGRLVALPPRPSIANDETDAAAVAETESAEASPAPLPQPAILAAAISAGPRMLPVAAIAPANLGTRRGESVPDALLSDIATRGVRQPLLLRSAGDSGERYEIVSGHRRWRAAQRAGLAFVPGIVGRYDDETAVLTSLKENLALGTLSPIEEAAAYLRLLTQCAMDASVLTAAIDRNRPHVVRCMRLLGLPPLVRHLITAGMLSPDHAYLLLDAPHPEALADAILAEGLSVEAARESLAAALEATP
jgi:ParB/RepB/Spo0J family partition protein